ncbi:pyridoxal phosphate-dependent aminotransferase family protein [soil metagenome]
MMNSTSPKTQIGAESRMADKLQNRITAHSLRKLTPANSGLVDFCSNDYLGIARSEELIKAAEAEWKRLRAAGTLQLIGSGGSRLLSGDSVYANELEEELAAFYKSESFLLFNSGYTGNLALFSTIPRRGDTIIFDDLIHASVRDGIKLSYAKSRSFSHNNLEELEEQMKKAEGEIFVAAEAVYSMDGDECPLEEMVELCEKYNASLILDEAHSNGLYGENGEGLSVGKGLQDRIFARLVTFGKAAGCHGAGVAGSKILHDYLVNYARPFIFTTALPVHDLAVIRCAVRAMPGKQEVRKQLFSFVDYFKAKALEYPSIKLLPSSSPIQGILIGGNEATRAIAAACRENNFDLRAVLAPTVPLGEERLRVIIHAYNHPMEIDKLLRVIATVV